MNVEQVLALPMAQDWGVLFRARVTCANIHHIPLEASRATIEVLTRKLRTRKWTLSHTSKSKRDRRADSRYYRSPTNRQFVIRISNHTFPNGKYNGAKDYIIDRQMMEQYNVLGLIKMIEADEKAFNVYLPRHEKKSGQ